MLADQSEALVMARVVENYEYEVNGQLTFRSRLLVEESVKGDLLEGIEFNVQKWEKLIDGTRMTMWGDINLYEGARYLLFLEKKAEDLYHPLCFSYYVFEEITMEGQSYIVPSEEAREFEIIDQNEAEPLYVYDKNLVMPILKAHVNAERSWDGTKARTSLKINDFYGMRNSREAPTGCTFLQAGSKDLRWKDFATGNGVGIHYTSNSVSGCPTAIAKTQTAINQLIGNFPGIMVSDMGSVAPFADCADASAVGSDFRSYIDNSFGNYRHVVIQFEDPCDQIGDLSSCGGVLALGGAYGIGSHDFDGKSWATAKYGYVIVNNGVGNCKCSVMDQLLSHELLHSLGLGHISGSTGSANMNSTCCNEITGLDETCVNYSYPSEAQGALLPIRLKSFEGQALSFSNRLQWETGYESNVDRFEVERAINPEQGFEVIGQVPSRGDTDAGHTYEWIDKGASREDYYRLRSVDFDGQTSVSNVVILTRKDLARPVVFPTIASEYVQIKLPEGGATKLQVTSISGQVMKTQMTDEQHLDYEIDDLPNGWYGLQISNESYSETYRFLKSD